jgi:hypothetical protein
MPANQVSGVQHVPGAADLSLDLANRVPQLLPFSFEFLLELMDIFICTHKTRHPPPLGIWSTSYRRSFSHSAMASEGSIARSRLSKMLREISLAKGLHEAKRRGKKGQMFQR